MAPRLDTVAFGAACLLALALLAPAALGAPAARVVIQSVEPAWRDTLLVCTLETLGLPDPPSRETLESGLPSALVIGIALLDADGEELERARITVRIEPDLLEGTFLIRTPLLDLRAASLEELATRLARLGPLPVAPMARYDPRQLMRLQTRLAVHPLAPAETERVHALFRDGPGSPHPDRQEVLIGLGTLWRRFFGGGSEEDWIAEQTSPTFRADALEEAP